MTDCELLYETAKAKKDNCYRESAILVARAEVHSEYMNALERVIESESKALKEDTPK